MGIIFTIGVFRCLHEVYDDVSCREIKASGKIVTEQWQSTFDACKPKKWWRRTNPLQKFCREGNSKNKIYWRSIQLLLVVLDSLPNLLPVDHLVGHDMPNPRLYTNAELGIPADDEE